MRRTALVLAAHGSEDTPCTNKPIGDLADALIHRLDFDRIIPAFHRGRPHYSEVLDELNASAVVVVPIMTSAGYYCDDVLPRELARNRCHNDIQLTVTPPIGTHPGMTELVARQVRETASSLDLKLSDVRLVIVGHGTARHQRSRDATLQLVKKLRGLVGCAETLAAFLDDEPLIESVAVSGTQRDVLVVPFLIGTGGHAALDIPNRLGMSADGDSSLPRVEAIDGRAVVCVAPVGSDAGLLDLIADLAMGAVDKLSKGRNGAWSGRRSSDIDGEASRTTFARAEARGSDGGREPVGHEIRRWKLGTRGSEMALWQANFVAERLRSRGAIVDIATVLTSGDRELGQPIAELSSDSPFTDEIEEALIRGDIDLAVHSLKDLPVHQSTALRVVAILKRGDPSESLISLHRLALDQLPAGARVGTSSPRRRAQLLRARSDLRPIEMRGPVDDRVRQVCEGQYDAAILATVGLERLGMSDEISEMFALDRFIPAPGQAALAVQVRREDVDVIRLVSFLEDRPTRLATDTELAFLREFDAEASIAVAAHAVVSDDIVLRAGLMSLDGGFMRQTIVRGNDCEFVARDAARQLEALMSSEHR